MKTSTKIIFGCLAVIALGICASAFIHAAKGFDASKEDPQKLFMFYVQKQIPTTAKMITATGNATPMGGTGITFRFRIAEKEMNELIAAKHLQKTDELQPGLFSAKQLGEMKHPEFYWTDTDTTWSSSHSGVRMAVDKDSSTVLYMVFSS